MLSDHASMNRFKLLIICFLLVGAGWFFFGSSNNDQDKSSGKGEHHGAGGKNAAVPVALATAKTGDISVYLEELGSITPRSQVTVHTLINGQLMNVLFTEGQMVKKDNMLAQIDDRPYVAALEQAQGSLARDQALLAEAKIDLARYQLLWKQDSIAKQQLDTQASLVKQDEGAVLNDQGQVDNAKVNLVYTKITAPVNGRVGLRQVDAGNIVHTTDTNGIVVVTELQPITSIFTIPEDNIPNIFKHTADNNKLVAEAWDRDNKNKLATGVLTAVDNQVDSTTGTVKARAEFANEDNALFPSQFVNIRLKLDTLKDVVTIPTSAVQRGTHGTFVYLAKPDNTVSVQNITLGPADGEIVSVTEGIKIGDQMVVDGADNLRDGAKIEVAKSDTTATPAGAAPADDTNAKNDDTKTDDAKKSGGHHHKHQKGGDDTDKDKTP